MACVISQKLPEILGLRRDLTGFNPLWRSPPGGYVAISSFLPLYPGSMRTSWLRSQMLPLERRSASLAAGHPIGPA